MKIIIQIHWILSYSNIGLMNHQGIFINYLLLWCTNFRFFVFKFFETFYATLPLHVYWACTSVITQWWYSTGGVKSAFKRNHIKGAKQMCWYFLIIFFFSLYVFQWSFNNQTLPRANNRIFQYLNYMCSFYILFIGLWPI